MTGVSEAIIFEFKHGMREFAPKITKKQERNLFGQITPFILKGQSSFHYIEGRSELDWIWIPLYFPQSISQDQWHGMGRERAHEVQVKSLFLLGDDFSSTSSFPILFCKNDGLMGDCTRKLSRLSCSDVSISQWVSSDLSFELCFALFFNQRRKYGGNIKCELETKTVVCVCTLPMYIFVKKEKEEELEQKRCSTGILNKS